MEKPNLDSVENTLDPTEILTEEDEEIRDKYFQDKLNEAEDEATGKFVTKNVWGSREMVMEIIEQDLPR